MFCYEMHTCTLNVYFCVDSAIIEMILILETIVSRSSLTWHNAYCRFEGFELFFYKILNKKGTTPVFYFVL